MTISVKAVFVGQFHIVHGPQILYLKCDDSTMTAMITANFRRWHDYYIPELPLCEQVIKIDLDELNAVVSCAIQHRSDTYERKKIEFNIALVLPRSQSESYDQQLNRNIRALANHLLCLEKQFSTVLKGDVSDFVDFIYEQFRNGENEFLIVKNKSMCVINFGQTVNSMPESIEDQIVLLKKEAKNAIKTSTFSNDFYTEVIYESLKNGMKVKDFLTNFARLAKRPKENQEAEWLVSGPKMLDEEETEERFRELGLAYLIELRRKGGVVLVVPPCLNGWFRLDPQFATTGETIIAQTVEFVDQLDTDIAFEPSIVREVFDFIRTRSLVYTDVVSYYQKRYFSRANHYNQHIHYLMLYLKHKRFVIDLKKHYYWDLEKQADYGSDSGLSADKLKLLIDRLKEKAMSAVELMGELEVTGKELEFALRSIGAKYILLPDSRK